ncbi:MAG: hypothetical protein ABI407_21180 [Bradyrhizobium sp.]
MMEYLDLESSGGFDWDKRKSKSNLDKHGIDFGDAVEIFMARSFFAGQIGTMRSAGSR